MFTALVLLILYFSMEEIMDRRRGHHLLTDLALVVSLPEFPKVHRQVQIPSASHFVCDLLSTSLVNIS